MNEEEFKRLKKEMDDLRKNKIITLSRLKQKEDKITELTKRVKQLTIERKESDITPDLGDKVNQLTDEIKRSRSINQKLRGENSSLIKQLEEAQKLGSSGTSKIQQVSSGSSVSPGSSGVSREEIKKFQAQLAEKDNLISSLNQELDSLSQGGGSYSKIRQLNAKIRELKGSLQITKRNEEDMKQRLYEMNRKLNTSDFGSDW